MEKRKKRIEIESVFPDEIEKFPWAGHLGIKLVEKVIPIIEQSKTTLLFTNTRGMSEIWFHTLLNTHPELAGTIALHHGSIDAEVTPVPGSGSAQNENSKASGHSIFRNSVASRVQSLHVPK